MKLRVKHRIDPREPRHGWNRLGIRLGLALLLALWVTGMALWWWPGDDLFQLAPWQAAMRRGAVVVHGVGAWVACVALGRWAWPHVTRTWHLPQRRTWWLGIAGLALLALVALSGLGLLYGPGDWHEGLVQWHWWVSVGWPALVLVHARRLLPRVFFSRT